MSTARKCGARRRAILVCLSVFATVTILSFGCSRHDDDSDSSRLAEPPQTAEMLRETSKGSVAISAGGSRLVNGAELEQLRELVRENPLDGLQVSEATEIAESEWGKLRRFSWRSGHEFGFGWHVRVSRTNSLHVIGAESTRPFESLLEESQQQVLAAINGGFFDDEGHPLDMVVSDGVVQTPLRSSGGSGVFVIRDGRADIVHVRASTRGARQALQSIDRIVEGGESLVRQASDLRAARAAVTIGPDGVELVVIAHGESVRSDGPTVNVGFASGFGLTLAEFADYLIRTGGPMKALNLDGGPSVQLRFMTSDGVMLRIDGGGPTASGIVLSGQRGE